MRISDWSSDVCSSDLNAGRPKNDDARIDRQRDVGGIGRIVGRALVEADVNAAGKRIDDAFGLRDRGGRGETRGEAAVAPCALRPADRAEVAELVGALGRASCRARVCRYV